MTLHSEISVFCGYCDLLLGLSSSGLKSSDAEFVPFLKRELDALPTVKCAELTAV